MARALICGVLGQDGAYLARLLLDNGYEVHGTTRALPRTFDHNLHRLGVADQVTLHVMNPCDRVAVERVVTAAAPDELYNLLGPSSVAASIEAPVDTFEAIFGANLRLLEVLRESGGIRYYYAGTSEVFGNTSLAGADESTCFAPLSPYAVAKAAACMQVKVYRETYGISACYGLLFNHESTLRPGHFVTKKVVKAACAIAKGAHDKLRLGNLDVVRDWGAAEEYVRAMWLMASSGADEDLVVGTGRGYSLRDLVEVAFSHVGLDWREHVESDASFMRPRDVVVSIASPGKVESVLGWRAGRTMPEVICDMVDAELMAETEG